MRLTLDTATIPRWAYGLAAVGLIAGAVLYLERVHDERARQERIESCMRAHYWERRAFSLGDYDALVLWGEAAERDCPDAWLLPLMSEGLKPAR